MVRINRIVFCIALFLMHDACRIRSSDSIGKGAVDHGWRIDGLHEWAIGPFTRQVSSNPILTPSDDTWESSCTIAPTIIVRDGRFYMLYRGLNKDWREGGVDHIGLAWSDDGLHWEKYDDNPVLRASENYEKKGAQDPRLVSFSDTYYLTYTGWHEGGYDLCLATSKDLIHWKKYGPLFSGIGSTKSGTIVQNPNNEAVRIQGKFVIYLLESYGDFHNDWIAYSDDLLHWDAKRISPLLGGESCIAITDYQGPNDDIVLFYAGNLLGKGDNLTHLSWDQTMSGSPVKYAINEALFSREDPEHLLDVLEIPLLKPQAPYEDATWKDCMFMQGLTRHQGRWWLYYGGCYPENVIALATGEAHE